MTNKAQLINRYNKKNRSIIISEYMPSSKGSTGLARFASNTAESLGSNLIIITNKLGDHDEISQKDGNLLIRCFQKNSPFSFFNIFTYLFKLNKVRNILFEFEFASYGNISTVILIPFLTLLMRMLGKKVFFATHQVSDNLRRLHSHLGLSKNSPLILLFDLGLKSFYAALGIFCEKVIVLEEEFRLRLKKFINKNKIVLIPHGVESLKTLKNTEIREKMSFGNNDFIILVFGYIAWYKGLDRLIDSFNEVPSRFGGKTIKLIIAGGYSQAQAGKEHYEKHYKMIVEKAKKNKRIIITGFVPEEKIVNYYSLADLCLIPYREFVSSSGPLSLSLSFGKPIILSKELKDYTKSNDFKKSLLLSKLSIDDLFIDINSDGLKQVIKKVIFNRNYKKSLINFSIRLKRFRSWNKISEQYKEILFERGKKLTLPKINFNLKIRDLLIRYNLN